MKSDQFVDASCDVSYLCIAPHAVIRIMRSVNRYFVNRPQASKAKHYGVDEIAGSVLWVVAGCDCRFEDHTLPQWFDDTEKYTIIPSQEAQIPKEKSVDP